MGAAAVVFFAYIGFDAVSTTAEEAKNPRRDLPIGIIASLVVCTILYLADAAILSGIVPVIQYRSNAALLADVPAADPNLTQLFLNAPVAYPLSVIGLDWASYLVSAGAVAGITSVLLVMLLSQPRIFFAMSRDGLLPQWFAKTHPVKHVPSRITWVLGIASAVIAGFLPIAEAAELTNIGILLAFVVVCVAVIVLRYKQPDLPRTFKTPGMPVVPIIGVIFSIWLITFLTPETWLRFAVWFVIGLVIYFAYSKRNSVMEKSER